MLKTSCEKCPILRKIFDFFTISQPSGGTTPPILIFQGFLVYLEDTLKSAVHVLGEQIKKLREAERSWGTIELFEEHNTAFWCTSKVH